MAVRDVIKIDEEKCNGCGNCVVACAEGAIQIINGKAKVVSEKYCDGLGACIGKCPAGALEIVRRNAVEFDEAAVGAHLKKIGREPLKSANHNPHAYAPMHACPGSLAQTIRPKASANKSGTHATAPAVESALCSWPVQLQLVSPRAEFFNNADLLVCADCVPFALAGFHAELLRGKIAVIGCPKLDDAGGYAEKLAEILSENNVKSVTVAHMEVPCCFGLEGAVESALRESGKKIPLETIVLSINGKRVKN